MRVSRSLSVGEDLSREFSSLVVCFQSECSLTCAPAIDRDLES